MSCKIKCPDTWGELFDVPGNKGECPYFVCVIPEDMDIPECKVSWNKLLYGCNHECYNSRIPDVLKADFDEILTELNAADPDPGYDFVTIVMHNYLKARRNHNV